MLTLEEYEKLNPRCQLVHEGVTMRYCTPTTFTKWRVDSFFEKEPSTVEWLTSFTPGAVLVDVGANVGMYTIWLPSRDRRAFSPSSPKPRITPCSTATSC